MGNPSEATELKEIILNDMEQPDSVASSPGLLSGEEGIDFVLAWDGREELAASEESYNKRRVFEANLRKEGLLVDLIEGDSKGMNFVRISAPETVLKRYAEILKLRLPMKTIQFRHITEIKVEGLHIPLVTDAYERIKKSYSKFIEPFEYDHDKFKTRTNELTATYSRDKEYLFASDTSDFFSPSMRSRIISFILKRKMFSEDVSDEFHFGIDRLLSEGVYTAAYPLHDGSLKTPGSVRYNLFYEWAAFSKIFKFQPLDAVRDYYGVKIALYFAWLGFYTNLLVLPSIVGLFVFLYGLATSSLDVPSQDICNSTAKICPACDYFCDYWVLNETCQHSKIMYLFDNPTTVVFAIFMSFWAALFIEAWKRYSTEIAHRWDVSNYQPEEEHPRPEYIAQLKGIEEKTVNFVTQTMEPKVPFWSLKFPGIVVSASAILFMVCLGLAAVFGVILYRMSMIAALNAVEEETIKGNASLFISATGACINLLCILVFNQIYNYIAVWMTDLELNRTQTEYDDSLSLKIYLLQFVNYYASIFYIAFFKGKFVGYPGRYNRIFAQRQEECSPGGCYMELCMQMAIIFVGKQFLLSVVEYHLPRLWKLYNSFKVTTGIAAEERKGKGRYPQWIHDFKLADFGDQGLFYEYLEMIIQYGFITIFVSAFPLAPLFALLNNVFELRLDAKKLLVHHRRPVAQRVKDIGVWLSIMEGLGRIAVVTNGFIIAFTSEFIPKILYRVAYSEDGSLQGYTNFTLSYFKPEDFDQGPADLANLTNYVVRDDPEVCRYHGYRHPPWHENKYELTEVYWHVLVARLAFVVCFQNFVALSVMAIRLLIPTIAPELKERIRREAYLTNEIIIRTELLKAKGQLDAVLAGEYTDEADGNNGDVSGAGKGGDGDGSTDPLRRRRKPSARLETGDITDGHIMV